MIQLSHEVCVRGRREMEKMKDAVNAAAGGEGIPTRRIAGDAGREYILQTEEDTKAKAALDAGNPCHVCMLAFQQPRS